MLFKAVIEMLKGMPATTEAVVVRVKCVTPVTATPLPDTPIDCSVPATSSALSVRVTLSLSAPLCSGANSTGISHCCPALRLVVPVHELGSPLASIKSAG